MDLCHETDNLFETDKLSPKWFTSNDRTVICGIVYAA